MVNLHREVLFLFGDFVLCALCSMCCFLRRWVFRLLFVASYNLIFQLPYITMLSWPTVTSTSSHHSLRKFLGVNAAKNGDCCCCRRQTFNNRKYLGVTLEILSLMIVVMNGQRIILKLIVLLLMVRKSFDHDC